MARPAKNNCDYFSHDNNMRNHRKIKAIRSTFGISGYGIWCMILEHLTESNFNKFENSDTELELMAGDFLVSVTEIRHVIDYCIKLGLLSENNGIINSSSLDERLLPVFEKRDRLKSKSNQQSRTYGKFVTETTDSAVVSVTETPQSKVKESKVKESKVKESKVIIAVKPLHTQIEIDSFENFTNWIKDKAPTVGKMKEPFTIVQYLELKKSITSDQLKTMILKMHNYEPLLKKNKSAYLTFKNWSNKDFNTNRPEEKKSFPPGGSPQEQKANHILNGTHE